MLDEPNTLATLTLPRHHRRCEAIDHTGLLTAGEESMLCLHLERIIQEVAHARAACDQILSGHVRRSEIEQERTALHLCSRLDGLLNQAEDVFLTWTDKLEG